MEDQASGWGGRVDVFGQRSEPGALLLDLLDDLQEILQAPRQAVILGDYHHVPDPELIQHPVQLRPVAGGTGDHISKDPFRPGSSDGILLAVELLFGSRDTGIADDHRQKPPLTRAVLGQSFVHIKPLVLQEGQIRDKNGRICPACCG